jgi:hypothetical protein
MYMNATTSKVSRKKFYGYLSSAIALVLSGCGGIGSSTSNPPAVSVSLNQSSVNVLAGGTAQFKATVANSTNTAVTWSVDGVAGGNTTSGTVSATGLYTAPSKTGAHTVTAASVADTSATAKAAVAVGLLSLSPASIMVAPGGTQPFNATTQGFSNSGVTWSVDQISGGNSTVGTITASGVYTAPTQAGSHTVTAVSVADTSAVATATVTVALLTVSPASTLIAPGGSEQFSATIQGFSNSAVSWSVDQISGGNSAVGTISASGLYTAPSQTGSHTVTATSVADTSVSASATIGIATLSLSPTASTVADMATQQFTATVNGPANSAVTWSVDQVVGGNSAVGTISSTGLYTAPSQAGGHTITAASALNASLAASAKVSVFVFAVSPSAAAIAPSGTEQFTATIQGVTPTTVTWSVDGVAGGNATTGTISASGLYSAPSAIGAHAIKATSKADTSASVSAALTVINASQAAVLTYHNDDARDGAYLEEVSLTPSKVNAIQFGKLLSYPVDGQIYAQPLYLSQVSINGGTHDVVFVATQNDSVYAFDADATSAQPTTFWRATVGTPVNKQSEYGVFVVGVLSTPVIDATTNTIYVLAESSSGPEFTLHALDVATGAEKFGGPDTVTGTVSGTEGGSSSHSITLESSCLQRTGLALDPVTNAIYIGFGSCPHGWLVAYDKTNMGPSVQPTAVFNATPNDNGGGGLWSSGGAPAIDDTTGDLYLLTGVDFGDDIASGNSIASGYNDAFVRLSATDLSVLDYFIPDDNATLADNDADLGSGANIIVPGSATVPNITIGGGKDGNIYVVNRSNMGGYSFQPQQNNVLQTVQTGSGKNPDNNIFSTPVFWNGSIYYHCHNDVLRAFSWNANTNLMSTEPTSVGTEVYQTHGATGSLSANGAMNGIIWDIDNTAYVGSDPASSGPSVLHAYDATNVATELYNSSQASSGRDTAGAASKFTVPTIANGRVFVPTSTELDIYGLLTP